MPLKNTLIASAVMLLTMLGVHFAVHGRGVEPTRPFSTFPRRIGTWSGTVGRFDRSIYEKLGVDDSFLCDYRSSQGDVVQLYVGYYRSQKEGDLIHSPKNCMPGSGWDIVQSSLEELTVPGMPLNKVKVIKLILQKGPRRQIVLYWFQSRGRFIASEYMQKIYLVVDAVVKHRTDGAFVRLISPVEGIREKKTLDRLKKFAALLIPVLEEYIPS